MSSDDEMVNSTSLCSGSPQKASANADGQKKGNKKTVWPSKNPLKICNLSWWGLRVPSAQFELRRLIIFAIKTSVILLPNHVSNGCFFYFTCNTV